MTDKTILSVDNLALSYGTNPIQGRVHAAAAG